MLCPCCGKQMPLGPGDCSCGARIVGEPLPESPFKVQRLGPVMTAVAVAIAAAGCCRITVWVGLGAPVAIWLAWRAVRLARRDPQGYGGYRVACVTLAMVLTAATSLAGFEIYRIPRYLEKEKLARQAATEAAILQMAVQIEECRRKNGSYPFDTEAMTKITGAPAQLDYWQKPIMYASSDESAAVYNNYFLDKGPSQPGEPPFPDLPSADEGPGIEFHSFELRSAGPDGILGTADDIVMRDGVFCTNPKVITRPIYKDSPDR